VEARGKVVKRRVSVLPFFGRGHFLNRELGKLRHQILKSFDNERRSDFGPRAR